MLFDFLNLLNDDGENQNDKERTAHELAIFYFSETQTHLIQKPFKPRAQRRGGF